MSNAIKEKGGTRALEVAFDQIAAGKTKQQIADEIGYSRPAVSRFMSGTYGTGQEKIAAAILLRYLRRICPADGEEKQPAQCQRIALRPRPHGFPDAESLWVTCQTCQFKPEGFSK